MLERSTPDSLVEERVRTLLARSGSHSLSLSRLHRALTNAFGPVFARPSALRDWLRGRPDRFAVLDPPACVRTTASVLRERPADYAAVLEAAGLPAEPRVALAVPPPADDDDAGSDTVSALVRRVDASIFRLCRARRDDPTLPGDAAEAMAAARELRRTLAVGRR